MSTFAPKKKHKHKNFVVRVEYYVISFNGINNIWFLSPKNKEIGYYTIYVATKQKHNKIIKPKNI